MSVQHTSDRKTLLTVIIVSLVYPAALYVVISTLAVTSPTARYALTVFSAAVLLGLALWAMNRDGISRESVGWTKARVQQALGYMVVAWVVLGAAHGVAVGSLRIGAHVTVPALIQQWLFVGMAEEMLYRGYLLQRLQREFSHWAARKARIGAVVVSSLLFAAMHIPVRLFNQFSVGALLVSLLWLFVLGIAFSVLYLRTGNVVFTGLAHGSWNVPLFGVQGDFFQLIVLFAVVEVAKFRGSLRQKADV